MMGLALLLTLLSQVGALNPVQGAFLTVTQPFERGLSAVFRPIASFLSDAGDLDSLQAENRRLRIENEALTNQVVQLQQDAERIKELEAALGVVQADAAQTKLAANVVHRDRSPFTDVIGIDRGTNDGVRTGMVVLSAQGTLLGTVTKALSDQSFVRLVTDSKSKVAAEVQDSKADGVVKGTAERGLVFDLAQADIKVGDVIVTSALTGRFPAGIPIGKVTSVGGTSQDLFRTVDVEPLVRVGTVNTVLVLTSFRPQGVDETKP
jgi:rod shape-determining protein MreC